MPSGTCNCGSVKIEVADSAFPKNSVLCHCKNCRASSGSQFTVNLLIPSDQINFVKDSTLGVYEDKSTDSGGTLIRKFCLFEIGTVPAPNAQIFKRNFEKWEQPLEGVHLVDGMT
ncbi:GFA family protein [Sporobolomyces koalae]|uniref:GFA family protein n=1 Tax=Sporobolomyces koalae TaxID=500713 RepID=UPI00316B82A5